MNKKLLVVLIVVITQPVFGKVINQNNKFKIRCGWFDNPTPGNMTLHDKEGEWIIGIQGGYQVAGDWNWPKFKEAQWVMTNGPHGHGCACFKMKANKHSFKVLQIKRTWAKPLEACRKDKALKKWAYAFPSTTR